MKLKFTFPVVFATIFSSSLYATECNFTTEQDRLIKLASSYGEPFDLKKTLPAIVVQESFVGRYVVKINPQDGKLGSYGITHVLLETAMWLEGEKSSWRAKDVIAERLIKDDLYALQLAVKKLQSVQKSGKSWMQVWQSYNGNNPEYAKKIRSHIRHLESCGYFNWS